MYNNIHAYNTVMYIMHVHVHMHEHTLYMYFSISSPPPQVIMALSRVPHAQCKGDSEGDLHECSHQQGVCSQPNT